MVINDRFTPTLLQRLLLSPAGALVSRAMREPAFAAGLRRAAGDSDRLSRTDCTTLWRAFSRDGGHRAHRLVHYLSERRVGRVRERERRLIVIDIVGGPAATSLGYTSTWLRS